jgi:hypothetical protein
VTVVAWQVKLLEGVQLLRSSAVKHALKHVTCAWQCCS